MSWSVRPGVAEGLLDGADEVGVLVGCVVVPIAVTYLVYCLGEPRPSFRLSLDTPLSAVRLLGLQELQQAVDEAVK